MLLITTESLPSFHRSPTASPREEAAVVMPEPGRSGNIAERSVAVVVIKNARLFVAAAQMLAVDFGIDVPVHQNQIGPAIVVEVEEHGSPAQILRVQAQSRGRGRIGKGAVAVVAVQRRSIVGEIGFENVEMAVAVVVGDGRAHACLLAPVFVEGGARGDGDVGEGSIMIVAVENAGRAVAGDVNIGPAIFIEIERGDAEGE